MKSILTALAVVTLVGCSATSGNKQLSSDKLNQIVPAKTTRAELIKWFGDPMTVGIDENGMASAGWVHVRAVAGPFAVDVKQQILAVNFDTNNVVKSFTFTDPIKSTNGAPTIRATSPRGN